MQSRLDIEPLDSVLTKHYRIRSPNKPRHQSAVTDEDFCCGFRVVVFGLGPVFALGFLIVAGARDADGSAVDDSAAVTTDVSAEIFSIGQGVANVMRLAIV